MFQKKKKKHKTIDFYLDDELIRIFQTIRRLEKDPDLANPCMFARFLLGTGIRMNEVRMLKIKDCNPEYFTVKEGKGGKVTHPEPSPEFKPYYQAHLEKCVREGKTWFFGESRRHGRLRQLRDRALGLRTLRDWWRLIIEASSVRYLPPHDGGRKTFINWYKELLARQDMQEQVGHESYRTTDQYYCGSIPGRRFNKPEPQWKKWARPPTPEEVEERLRIIQGGRI